MTGVTTGQTSLPTATDSDDNENFLTVGLTAALQALANLFESASGHDHSGSGKGKPIVTAGIASGITLTSPHMTTPVVDSGGLTITSGGIAVTGNSTITGTLGGLTGLTVASGTVNVSGVTLVNFGSPRFAITNAATASAGGGVAIPATVRGFFTIINDATSETVKVPFYSN